MSRKTEAEVNYEIAIETICKATDATSEMLANAIADGSDSDSLEQLHLLLWRARWNLRLSPEIKP
jgi:hypothetical protein